MMKEYFEELENGLQTAIDNNQGSIRMLYSLEIARLGKRLYSGEDKVAWCGIIAPFDLLSALDVTSCFVEFIGAMMAATNVAGDLIEETNHIGYSSDSCSYHRAVMGATMKELMPKPELLIGTTCPCSGGLAVIENLAAHFEKSFYLLQIPQDQAPKNVRYLADQMREMVSFVTKITGIPMDTEKVKFAMETSNKIREVLIEIFNLAKQVPSPVTGKDLSNFGIVMALFSGTESGLALAEAFRDELKQRSQNLTASGSNEKFRLLWIQNRIQFKNPIEKLLEDQYGAKIVIDELNDVTWGAVDPDDPYEGLASRAISIPFNGPAQNRVQHLQRLAEEYQVHGAINPCNWGCRQGTGSRGLIEASLKEIGVPVLNLEVDCIDHKKFTEGQFRTRVEAFMEMMDS